MTCFICSTSHDCLSKFSFISFQVSRSIGDERDCCACINFIMHSAAPLLLPPALEAHISYLRIMVSKGRDVQAVVAWQQLAVLTQLGRIPRSSCDWFIDAIAAAAAGPSSPALRMALATALRSCVIAHQLSPLPLLSRFLSFTLVPEPAVSEVPCCSFTMVACPAFVFVLKFLDRRLWKRSHSWFATFQLPASMAYSFLLSLS